MCKHDTRPAAQAMTATSSNDELPWTPAADVSADIAPSGSRRRRLWDLDGHAHCPVVGVCMPMAALRRLVDKVVGSAAVADDYEMHCGVVAECKHRTRMAEAVQKELDRRFQLSIRRAARYKCTEALAAWWHEASAGKDLAGAFWATLTHPRCTPGLEHQVLGEVHMLQHQVGMATRVALERFEALIDENAVLARELAGAQARSMRQTAAHAQGAEAAEAALMRLRAQAIGRETEIAHLNERFAALEAAAPDLRTRFDLARECHAHTDRIQELQRALLRAQQDAERQSRRADDATADASALRRAKAANSPAAAGLAAASDAFSDRAILCVGGRPASVPGYRQLIERTGGRFLHHDGGEEDNASRLDATLAAADLVICQTGCVSHDAYWRVKDHCKRTGKRCVFVETPSRRALERALSEVCAAAAAARVDYDPPPSTS